MKIVTYLFFDGRCEAAFAAYAEILGGNLTEAFRYSDAPGDMPVAPEWRDKIMHTSLAIGDQVLMASDAPPERYDGAMRGASVSVTVTSPEEAERIFAALGAGGTIFMPMAETFWALRFGMLADRYGTRWMISCEPAAA